MYVLGVELDKIIKVIISQLGYYMKYNDDISDDICKICKMIRII